MKPLIIGPNGFDQQDPVNRGGEADDQVGYTHAHLRRIAYCDPLSRERFVFLPTDLTLRPGLIALLYFLRWKIEKVFDVSKNKLRQQKAWANGDSAAHTEGHFIALAHNPLTILLVTLEGAGIGEQKIERQQMERTQRRPASQRVPAQEMVRHAAQLTASSSACCGTASHITLNGTTPCRSSGSGLKPIFNVPAAPKNRTEHVLRDSHLASSPCNLSLLF